MKITLYFGSFNPIHNGHTSLAEYIVNNTDTDELWLVVSPNNPLKNRTELWDEQLRLRLAQLAVEDKQKIKVTDFEFRLPRPSYTIDTLRAFSREYPHHEFTLLIGSDNMTIFHKWKDYKDILLEYKIFVYPRRGDNISRLQTLYPEMSVLADAPQFDISSTQIREKLKNGEDVSAYVNPKVADYINNNF